MTSQQPNILAGYSEEEWQAIAAELAAAMPANQSQSLVPAHQSGYASGGVARFQQPEVYYPAPFEPHRQQPAAKRDLLPLYIGGGLVSMFFFSVVGLVAIANSPNRQLQQMAAENAASQAAIVEAIAARPTCSIGFALVVQRGACPEAPLPPVAKTDVGASLNPPTQQAPAPRRSNNVEFAPSYDPYAAEKAAFSLQYSEMSWDERKALWERYCVRAIAPTPRCDALQELASKP